MQIVIISGVSGAGKTQALRSFEDLGFYCVDNLPPVFIADFLDVIQKSGGKIKKIALVVDIRSGEMFSDAAEAIDEIEAFEAQNVYLEE